MKTLLRYIAIALSVAAATWLIPGIVLEPGDRSEMVLTIALVALVVAAVNVFIKPFMTAVSACFILITLGVFLWVVNAAALMLVSWLSGQFGIGWTVLDWGAAFLGSLVISIVTALVNGLTGAKDRSRD